MNQLVEKPRAPKRYPQMVETYTLLRLALAQVAQFRQDLHAVRAALALRMDRAIREKGSEPRPPESMTLQIRVIAQPNAEPWRPMSLRMAKYYLRLIRTTVVHMKEGELINGSLALDIETLLLQISGELNEARKKFRTPDHLAHLQAEGNLEGAKQKAKKVVSLFAPIRSQVELALELDGPRPKRRKRALPTDHAETPPGNGPPPKRDDDPGSLDQP